MSDNSKMKVGVGMVKDLRNPKSTAFQAATEAVEDLSGNKPDIFFVFSSVAYNQKAVLEGVNQVADGTMVVGCSAAGEISPQASDHESVVVMAMSAPKMNFSVGKSNGVSKDSFKAGADAAKATLKAAGKKKFDLFIMIADGMTGNGADIVKGVQSVLGENFPIIGGSAGDDYRFEKTYEYFGDKVLTDSVIGIGLSGDFKFGFGIRHGWEPVGLPMTVTEAEGTVIKKIDGKPALKVYEDYFQREASELIEQPLARMAYTYPLGVAVEGSDELLIRDPVVANKKGEITMASETPKGSIVRLMIGDQDNAKNAADWAANRAKEQLGKATPKCAIMFNCMARKKLFGMKCHEENALVSSIIGKDVPIIGFYTYGEKGPLLGKIGTPAYFHNETMTMLLLGD